MSPDELKRLIKNEDYSSKWEGELTNYKSDDLDDDALKDFYQSSKDCGRLSMKEYDKENFSESTLLIRGIRLSWIFYLEAEMLKNRVQGFRE